MRAIIYTEYGPPEVVKLMEVKKPTPKEKEVLIKIFATTVNRTDCGFRSAEYFIVRFFSGLLRPKNKTLGNEFAGEIEVIGKNVTSFKVGDKVFGYNDIKFGAHAEYMIMAENEAITTIPTNLTYEEAAPITEGGHYALCDLRAAKIKSGQKILINGATGAIGSAAVQLAKYFGAEVTGVCDTKNVELIKSLGADAVVDYTKQDFTKTNQTYDIIFDAVGKSSFRQCKPILNKRGIYMSTELGKNSENIFLALTTPLLGGKKVLFPIPTITKEDVIFLKELVETGKYKPVIDRRYTLEQIVEAYKYVETGQKTGNVLITLT
ncbi:NAD(P)-dependent alcohol dehydrogenase [Gillisia limnaea]|uniref:Alcohol dehydrogenase zinc-binding domain protein n=1 Tax=Gillisia limnaea (strain DSM 15749 / LMG 21470 / R-8282) TaxID=865937 RepID=H2BS25_GILLR|nr:NAD(P)-dependent alcohol dehydrogenase [Gillisia limnaea]EHQ03551.1 Alcohol dehydrogenase zinc-binding domain protein [Gillisia limnaea DSM 15749]